MSIKKSTRGALAATATLALMMSLAACSGETGGTKDAGQSGTYTAAEVAAGSGSYQVKPLFAVPKTLPEKYSLAFLNNGKSNAFFATWSQGMQDAAAFYGVDFNEADLDFKYENELTAYQGLAVKQPTVVGANVMNSAVYDQIGKDGAKVVLIDGTFEDAPHFGVSDEGVGQTSIATLEGPAKEKIAGDWAGRTVQVVGMSFDGCPPCDARVEASFAAAESTLGIPASQMTRLVPQGVDPSSGSQSVFNDFLTAHPNDVVIVGYAGDEPGIGVINAAKAAGRSGDVLVLTNGGDEAARAALRDSSNAGILVGVLDYQPYAEGWNWVEAAIATAMGKSFDEYSVERVLTAENVDQFYPND